MTAKQLRKLFAGDVPPPCAECGSKDRRWLSPAEESELPPAEAYGLPSGGRGTHCRACGYKGWLFKDGQEVTFPHTAHGERSGVEPGNAPVRTVGDAIQAVRETYPGGELREEMLVWTSEGWNELAASEIRDTRILRDTTDKDDIFFFAGVQLPDNRWVVYGDCEDDQRLWDTVAGPFETFDEGTEQMKRGL